VGVTTDAGVREQFASRLLVLVAAASLLASADLLVKLAVATPMWAFHYRNGLWAAVSLATLLGAAALALVPSTAVAAAAGVMSGGVLGNLISWGWNGDYVPNPIVVVTRSGVFAFNVADIVFLVGVLMLTGALASAAIRHRDRLLPPSRAEQWLYRRIWRDGNRPK